jgi:hypothetical protein
MEIKIAPPNPKGLNDRCFQANNMGPLSNGVSEVGKILTFLVDFAATDRSLINLESFNRSTLMDNFSDNITDFNVQGTLVLAK